MSDPKLEIVLSAKNMTEAGFKAVHRNIATLHMSMQRLNDSFSGLGKMKELADTFRLAEKAIKKTSKAVLTAATAMNKTALSEIKLQNQAVRMSDAFRKQQKVLDRLQKMYRASGGEAEALGRKIRKTSEASSKGLDGLLNSATGLKRELTGIVSIYGAINLGRSFLDAGIQMDTFRKTMTAATGSATKAKTEFAFLRKESERLGLVFTDQISSYAQLTAAAKGTALEGKGIRDAFTGISEAMVSMGSSSDNIRGTFRALVQILGKGQVMAEELKNQMGERLVGAMNLAAKAMGKTREEFTKMLAEGKVLPEEFIPAFSKVLREQFAGTLDESTKSAQSNLNRLANTWNDIQVTFMDSGGLDLVVDVVKNINDGVKDWLSNNREMIAQDLPRTLDVIKMTLEGVGKAVSFVSWGLGQVYDRLKTFAIASTGEMSWEDAIFNASEALEDFEKNPVKNRRVVELQKQLDEVTKDIGKAENAVKKFNKLYESNSKDASKKWLKQRIDFGTTRIDTLRDQEKKLQDEIKKTQKVSIDANKNVDDRVKKLVENNLKKINEKPKNIENKDVSDGIKELTIKQESAIKTSITHLDKLLTQVPMDSYQKKIDNLTKAYEKLIEKTKNTKLLDSVKALKPKLDENISEISTKRQEEFNKQQADILKLKQDAIEKQLKAEQKAGLKRVKQAEKENEQEIKQYNHLAKVKLDNLKKIIEFDNVSYEQKKQMADEIYNIETERLANELNSFVGNNEEKLRAEQIFSEKLKELREKLDKKINLSSDDPTKGLKVAFQEAAKEIPTNAKRMADNTKSHLDDLGAFFKDSFGDISKGNFDDIEDSFIGMVESMNSTWTDSLGDMAKTFVADFVSEISGSSQQLGTSLFSGISTAAAGLMSGQNVAQSVFQGTGSALMSTGDPTMMGIGFGVSTLGSFLGDDDDREEKERKRLQLSQDLEIHQEWMRKTDDLINAINNNIISLERQLSSSYTPNQTSSSIEQSLTKFKDAVQNNVISALESLNMDAYTFYGSKPPGIATERINTGAEETLALNTTVGSQFAGYGMFPIEVLELPRNVQETANLIANVLDNAIKKNDIVGIKELLFDLSLEDTIGFLNGDFEFASDQFDKTIDELSRYVNGLITQLNAEIQLSRNSFIDSSRSFFESSMGKTTQYDTAEDSLSTEINKILTGYTSLIQQASKTRDSDEMAEYKKNLILDIDPRALDGVDIADQKEFIENYFKQGGEFQGQLKEAFEKEYQDLRDAILDSDISSYIDELAGETNAIAKAFDGVLAQFDSYENALRQNGATYEELTRLEERRTEAMEAQRDRVSDEASSNLDNIIKGLSGESDNEVETAFNNIMDQVDNWHTGLEAFLDYSTGNVNGWTTIYEEELTKANNKQAEAMGALKQNVFDATEGTIDDLYARLEKRKTVNPFEDLLNTFEKLEENLVELNFATGSTIDLNRRLIELERDKQNIIREQLNQSVGETMDSAISYADQYVEQPYDLNAEIEEIRANFNKYRNDIVEAYNASGVLTAGSEDFDAMQREINALNALQADVIDEVNFAYIDKLDGVKNESNAIIDDINGVDTTVSDKISDINDQFNTLRDTLLSLGDTTEESGNLAEKLENLENKRTEALNLQANALKEAQQVEIDDFMQELNPERNMAALDSILNETSEKFDTWLKRFWDLNDMEGVDFEGYSDAVALRLQEADAIRMQADAFYDSIRSSQDVLTDFFNPDASQQRLKDKYDLNGSQEDIEAFIRALSKIDENAFMSIAEGYDVSFQEFGADMNDLIRSISEAGETAQQTAERMEDLSKSLEQTLFDLTGGDLSPVQSDDAYRSRYSELYAGAMTGDEEAIKEYQSFIPDFVEFFKEFGGYGEISPNVIQDVNRVNDIVESNILTGQNGETDPVIIGQTIADQIQPVLHQILTERPDFSVNIDGREVFLAVKEQEAMNPNV